MSKSLKYPGQMIGPYFCGLGGRVVNPIVYFGERHFLFLSSPRSGTQLYWFLFQRCCHKLRPHLMIYLILTVAKLPYIDLLKARVNNLQILSNQVWGLTVVTGIKVAFCRIGIFLTIPCKDSLLD